MLCRPWLLPSALRQCFFQPARGFATPKKSQLDPVLSPSSPQHHDLQSFLEYAKRTGLKEISKVYQGTLYEYTVQTALRRLHFDLVRVGQAGDEGVDLIGTWQVPTYPRPLRVFMQCKNFTKQIGPRYVRELDGTYAYLPPGWRGAGVIGFLVARKRASRSVRLSLRRSPRPMAFINVRIDGTIREFVWNEAAQMNGLDSLQIAHRYLTGRKEGRVHKDIALYWKGVVLPYAKDEKGNVAGMLDNAQKDVLIAHARYIKDHIWQRSRVGEAVTRIQERPAKMRKVMEVKKAKQNFRIELRKQKLERFRSMSAEEREREKQRQKESTRSPSENRIGGFPNEHDYNPLSDFRTKKIRGRPRKINIDEFGFPTTPES